MSDKLLVNDLHWHRCYSCEDMLVCACDDRRQFDRQTGKERRIYCFGCKELNEAMRMAFGSDLLERLEGHAEKIQ